MILQGHVLDILPTIPESSVDCVVTSPPYWGLRDYKCDGQIGLEKTPEEYVSLMVDVFREARRVLKLTGCLFLNLGDSYNGSGGNHKQEEGYKNDAGFQGKLARGVQKKNFTGLKPKDLCGIPWRVAFALQADGWWLRSDIIWSKTNPMPESVTDRPTKSHEYIFLLTKSAKYFWNQEAVREPNTDPLRTNYVSGSRIHGLNSDRNDNDLGERSKSFTPNGRNIRSVWTFATEPTPEAHFATFPQELVKRCILAGCPEGGMVLDPFIGSGTTGIVAENLYRKWIGIELNPEYIKIAEKRLKVKANIDQDNWLKKSLDNP